MAVRNGEPLLADQLNALVAEELAPHIEVVVADNGSTDRTVEIAAAFRDRIDLRVVDASGRRGRSYALNRGVEASTGDHIVFLDHDDVITPGYLAAMGDALRGSQFVCARIDVAALNAEWVTRTRDVPQTRELPRDQGLAWAYGATLGVSRRVWELVGGFDEELDVAAEDIDFCWRVQEAGIPLALVEGAVLRYRLASSLRAIFRQGRRYGVGAVAVLTKHRELVPVRRRTFWSWFRLSAGAVRLAVLSRDKGRRGSGLFLLGRRIGMIEGSIRFRTWFW
jgi:GT2 family glycosyltransferase